MPFRPGRDELVALVRLLQNGEGSDEEAARWLAVLQRLSPHISDLIFYNDEELTAEQVIERAAAYRPIAL